MQCKLKLNEYKQNIDLKYRKSERDTEGERERATKKTIKQ